MTMGMFDYVVPPEPVLCPKCGNPLGDFQSKDGPCTMATLTIGDVDNFYTSCSCGRWVAFNRKRPRMSNMADFELEDTYG